MLDTDVPDVVSVAVDVVRVALVLVVVWFMQRSKPSGHKSKLASLNRVHSFSVLLAITPKGILKHSPSVLCVQPAHAKWPGVLGFETLGVDVTVT